MAVSRLQAWRTVATSSDDPQGVEVVIPSGVNRTMILVHSSETAGDYTASCAIGGTSATGRGGLFWESGGAADLSIKYWYWNEAAIAAMSATTSISWTESVVQSKAAWTWTAFGSVDQTTPITADTSVDTTVNSANGMTIPTAGETGDYVVIFGHRDSSNREFGTDGTLTEIYDVDANASRGGLFDGAWATSEETIRGTDNISDVMILGALVLNAAAGAATTVSGSGSPSGVIATIAGTGERIIVGNGSASVIAAIVSATAERIITATGSASPSIVVFSATGTAGPPAGNFVVAVPVQTTIVDDPIGKSVNVQGL